MVTHFVKNVKMITKYNNLIFYYAVNKKYYSIKRISANKYNIHFYGEYKNEIYCPDVKIKYIKVGFESGNWIAKKYIDGHTVCRDCYG